MIKIAIMKHFLLTVLCCFVTGMAMAQATAPVPVQNITVKGTVIDSAANKPLGYGTVALQDAATKAPVKSVLAKDDGSFELKAPKVKPINWWWPLLVTQPKCSR